MEGDPTVRLKLNNFIIYSEIRQPVQVTPCCGAYRICLAIASRPAAIFHNTQSWSWPRNFIDSLVAWMRQFEFSWICIMYYMRKNTCFCLHIRWTTGSCFISVIAAQMYVTLSYLWLTAFLRCIEIAISYFAQWTKYAAAADCWFM